MNQILYINSDSYKIYAQKKRGEIHMVVFLLILILCCLIFGGKNVGVTLVAILAVLAAMLLVYEITGSATASGVIVVGGLWAWIIYDLVKKKKK